MFEARVARLEPRDRRRLAGLASRTHAPRAMGRVDLAIAAAVDAIAVAERHDWTPELAEGLRALALMGLELADSEGAGALLERARPLVPAGDLLALDRWWRTRGAAALESGLLDVAHQALRRAVDLAEEAGSYDDVVTSSLGLARALVRDRRIAEARAVLPSGPGRPTWEAGPAPLRWASTDGWGGRQDDCCDGQPSLAGSRSDRAGARRGGRRRDLPSPPGALRSRLDSGWLTIS